MCLAFIKLTPICLGLSAGRYSRCDRNTFYNCNDKQTKSCDGGTFSGPFVDGMEGCKNVLEWDNAKPPFIIIENKTAPLLILDDGLEQVTHQALGLFIPFRRWILYPWPDDTQCVTNASKPTVRETHSACQAAQNQCRCNHNSADTAALFSIPMQIWLVCVRAECIYPRRCDSRSLECQASIVLGPLISTTNVGWLCLCDFQLCSTAEVTSANTLS